MKKIYVFGSFIMDHTTRCSHPPRDGESIFGDSFAISFGGKGINQAMMVKRLQGDVDMIGAIGNDRNGQAFQELLKDNNFDLNKVFIKDTFNGVSNIVIDESGQNRIIVVLGANNLLTSDDILSIKNDIKEDSIFLIQNEIPTQTIKTIIDVGHKKHATIVLNPAPYKKLDIETLNKVNYLTPNENEAADLFKLTHYDEKAILQGFDKLKTQYLIMTLGDKGALVYDHHTIKKIEPYKVKVIDTVGAGDAFNGGLVFGLGQGYPLDKCLIIANACGALTIQKQGALDSQPSLKEVEDFIKNN